MGLTSSTSFRSAFEPTAEATPEARPRLVSPNSYCVQGFSGSVDRDSAADFVAALDRVLRGPVDGIVLDFSGLNFFGTVGLVLLRSFVDDAGKQGIPVVLVGGRSVTRPLEICGMAPYVRVFDVIEDAGRALTQGDTGPSTMEFTIA
ncbi:STAS domain-containing protein [Gordonia sp. 'Campus']|uniref:STAS domain-containing protein n=1 Tax=Gordonia sp. 'Campus' TaxID=2915824 RepID=UPI001EE3FFAD|nr:STAS domain-containing protein [Gordonia sp. 'Campus']